MSNRYFEGSGSLTPLEQAEVAYREMRKSLVNFASVEAELKDHAKRGTMNPTREMIFIARRDSHRDRAAMFALVYQVEIDVATRAERAQTKSSSKLAQTNGV